jgi:hypothetical protein
MKDATTFVFVGRFEPESFVEFVHHRARRLALDVGVGGVSPDRVEVSVSGETDLIDAFEMACSLGPMECLVLDTFRSCRSERVHAIAARLANMEAPA